jgi:hypothetical protein
MSGLATTKTYNANNTIGRHGLFTRWTVLAQRRRINASDYTWSSVERDLDFGEAAGPSLTAAGPVEICAWSAPPALAEATMAMLRPVGSVGGRKTLRPVVTNTSIPAASGGECQWPK